MSEVRQQLELPSPLGLTSAQFLDAAGLSGAKTTHAALARYKAFYRRGESTPADPVPAPIRTSVSEAPEGSVTKFLLPVPGVSAIAKDLETESVLIPMPHGDETSWTLCVSSQVGCAMGCDFCETAQMGLIRSLTAGEIVAQWYAARHRLNHPVRNIVFMGMGEPLDNTEGVMQAIACLIDHNGPAIAASKITISTVGRAEGLRRLRERVLQPGLRQLNLAVSVNAPNDEIRSRIMPINRATPLAELMEILRSWPMRRCAAICIEYVLIPGVNDADDHADQLCALLKGLRCCVNVIPYNPRRNSPWPAPLEDDVWRFLRRLESHGQFCKRRKTKGRDTMAACGQLGNEHIRRRRLVDATVSAGA